ncbi:MAG: hypothetical protein ABR502_02910 [Chitinophagaceae bacterium]
MKKDNRNKAGSNATGNASSKPMDSKKEVETSNDEKIGQDFPGYLHYPAKEDIMDKRTDVHRVDMDVENLPNAKNLIGVSQRFDSNNTIVKGKEAKTSELDLGGEFPDIGPRTEIPKQGLESLDSTNAEIGIPQNADNEDLNTDLPGTHLDDEKHDSETDTDADVTPEERMTLEKMSMPTGDEDNLRRAALDNTDFDGDELNEEGFGEVLSSIDLDIPEETDETATTAMDQGDEENKYYSLGGDRQDKNEEDPYSGPNRGE